MYHSDLKIISFLEGVAYTPKGKIDLISGTTDVDFGGFQNQKLLAEQEGLRIVNHGHENDWVDEEGEIHPGEDFTLELLVPWKHFWDWVMREGDDNWSDNVYPHFLLHIGGCYKEMGCVVQRSGDGQRGIEIYPESL